MQVSGELDLDELESAQLVFESTDDAEVLGRSVAQSSVIRFHQRRQYLLDCYRLLLQGSNEVENSEEEGGAEREAFRNAINAILEADGRPGNGSQMIRKCLQHMVDIRVWLQTISDRFTSASVLGQTQASDIVESLEFQRVSLIQQHESLGMVLYHFVKGNHSTTADFEHCVGIIKNIEKYDNLLGIPILM